MLLSSSKSRCCNHTRTWLDELPWPGRSLPSQPVNRPLQVSTASLPRRLRPSLGSTRSTVRVLASLSLSVHARTKKRVSWQVLLRASSTHASKKSPSRSARLPKSALSVYTIFFLRMKIMDKLVSNNNPQYTYDISYGKAHVPLYRVYATPLTGITPIPESAFTGRDNTLFALEVDIEVFSQHVLPAYTHGDNTQVVATDSMKNFVLRHALTFNGSTLESFLASLGRQFLTTYPQMQSIRLTARELPFATVPVPQFATATFAASNVLYKRSHDDFAIAQIDFSLDGDTVAITDHRCGRLDLQLLKVTGSSFTRFVQDGYTTLPERSDRPLFIYLDVYWRYA